MGNFRTAQYGPLGSAIDDPNAKYYVNNAVLKSMRLYSALGGGKYRPKLAAAGNSLQAQSYPGYTTALQTNFYSHNDWMMAFLGHQFQWPETNNGSPVNLTNGTVSGGIYGASGKTTAEILVDLPTFFRYTGTIDIFMYQGMENDATTPEASYPVATNIADYERVILAADEAGAGLIYWIMCLPNVGINSAPLLTRFWQLCNAVKALAIKYPQLRVVPTFDLWTDTSGTYPVPANTGAFADYTDGSVHDRKGAIWLGQRIADYMALDGFTYANKLDLPGPGESGYIGGATNFFGSGGGFSGGYAGTLPPNLTLGTTLTGITTSTATAVANRGRPATRIDIAATTQAANNNVAQIFTGNIATGWSVGEEVQGFIEYEYDSGASFVPGGMRQASGNINFTGTASVALYGLHSGSFTYNEDIITGRPMMRATPRCRIPVGTTALRHFWTVLSDTTNAVLARVYVSKFVMVNWSRVGT